MNESPKKAHIAQNTLTNTEPRFGLFDIALFVLGHATVRAPHCATTTNRRSGNRISKVKRRKSIRLMIHRSLLRMQSRFQTLWSLPPVTMLQFSRKEAGYNSND
jgi:hypothetical protein